MFYKILLIIIYKGALNIFNKIVELCKANKLNINHNDRERNATKNQRRYYVDPK